MYALQFAIEQVHQLLVVFGIQLYQHRVRTSSKVALYHFGNVLQAFDHFFVHRSLLQVDTHIGTGGVAQALGIHIKSTTRDDISIDQMLHALMDSGT